MLLARKARDLLRSIISRLAVSISSDHYFGLLVSSLFKYKLIKPDSRLFLTKNPLFNRIEKTFISPGLSDSPVTARASNGRRVIFIISTIQTGNAKIHLIAFLSMIKLLLQSDEVEACKLYISGENRILNAFLSGQKLAIRQAENLEAFVEEKVNLIFDEKEKKLLNVEIARGDFQEIAHFYCSSISAINSFKPTHFFFYTGYPNDSYLLRKWAFNHFPVVQRFTQTRHETDPFTDVYITQKELSFKPYGKQIACVVPLNFSVDYMKDELQFIPESLANHLMGKFVVMTALSGRVVTLFSLVDATAKQKIVSFFENHKEILWLLVGENESKLKEENSLVELQQAGKLICLDTVTYFNTLVKSANVLLHLPGYPGGGWTGRFAAANRKPIICNQLSDMAELFSNDLGVYSDDNIDSAIDYLERCYDDSDFLNDLGRRQKENMEKEYGKSSTRLQEVLTKASEIYTQRDNE